MPILKRPGINSNPETQRDIWPIEFDRLKWPASLSATLVTVGLVILVLLLFIATLAMGWLLVDLVSGDQKRAAEATKAAFPILVAAIGLPLLVWRLRILDRQTRISDEKTQIDRETHYTSIFSRSIDQLGQTRELKKSVSTENGIEETSKTVPNIEVRLGGIHSLSRLAEESVRDREKIGNLLRSYIRENSWSDRTGQIADKLTWLRHSIWPWSYNLSTNPNDAEALEDRNTWVSKTDTQIGRAQKWTSDLPETRVDVNEAADALEAHADSAKSETKPTLYECLFVGRHFNRLFLAQTQFRRCTFVRCTFDIKDAKVVAIFDSQLLDCSLTGENSDVRITNSFLNRVRFRQVGSGIISVLSCDTHGLQFNDSPLELRTTNSTLYKFRLYSPIEEDADKTVAVTPKITLAGSLLIDARLENIKLSGDSNFTVLANVDTKFTKVDLSDVTQFHPDDLAAVNASSNTRHPSISDRPRNWPQFDEFSTDDEIPF